MKMLPQDEVNYIHSLIILVPINTHTSHNFAIIILYPSLWLLDWSLGVVILVSFTICY